jgi:hypothetical protein
MDHLQECMLKVGEGDNLPVGTFLRTDRGAQMVEYVLSGIVPDPLLDML